MPNTSASGGYLIPTSPPVEDQALDAVFQQMFVGLTALDGSLVRPRWQPVPPKQPAPSVNWIAFGIYEDEPDDNITIVHNSNDAGGLGSDTAIRHEKISILASFYGPNSSGLAKQVRDGLAISQNREVLFLQGIAFTNSDTIRAVPDLVNEQWIKRYDLQLHFRRKATRVYAVENILSAPVNIET